MIAALAFLAACSSASKTPAPTETVTSSVETSGGAQAPVDDASLSHLDSQGRQPEEVVLELIQAENSADFEAAYALYANPGADFDIFRREMEVAEPSYQDFLVHETRVIGPGLALVRVTYHAETTPGEGPRYPVDVEEPGEWWRVERAEGVWRVGWLPRQ